VLENCEQRFALTLPQARVQAAQQGSQLPCSGYVLASAWRWCILTFDSCPKRAGPLICNVDFANGNCAKGFWLRRICRGGP